LKLDIVGDMTANVGLQHFDGLMITAHWAGGPSAAHSHLE
jgi:hypothetical protein